MLLNRFFLPLLLSQCAVGNHGNDSTNHQINITNLVEDLMMARAAGALMEVEDFPQDLSSCCNIRHENRYGATEDFY